MKNKEIESAIEKADLTWEYIDTLPLAEVDIEKSLHNQARIGPQINDEIVDIYSTCLGAGDAFPALEIIRILGKSIFKYIVGNGNHRIMAAQKISWDTWPFGAYIISGTDVQLEKYIKTVNLINGLNIDIEERIVQAASLVHRHGYHIEKAADLFKVGHHRVQNCVNAQQVTERAGHLGVRHIDKISDTAKRELYRIKYDTLFAAVATLAAKKEFGANDIGQLVSAVEKAPSEKAALDIIDAEKITATQVRADAAEKNAPSIRVFKQILSLQRSANKVVIPEKIRLLSGETRKAALSKLDEILDLIQIVKDMRKF